MIILSYTTYTYFVKYLVLLLGYLLYRQQDYLGFSFLLKSNFITVITAICKKYKNRKKDILFY